MSFLTGSWQGREDPLLQSSIIQQVEPWYDGRSVFRSLALLLCVVLYKKSWGAPLPGKPSDRGQFGFPAETGAAPITGAPAAHCLKLLRHGLENLAGSDRKHHEYVPVLDCTVADEF